MSARAARLLRVALLTALAASPAWVVLDPDVATVRVPARLAAALGIRGDENGPPVPVLIADSTTLEAHPARIASLRIGPFAANDVDCLVLPEGYEAPTVLGASFLDQFVFKVDPRAAQLTLVKVDVKPTHAKAP